MWKRKEIANKITAHESLLPAAAVSGGETMGIYTILYVDNLLISAK